MLHRLIDTVECGPWITALAVQIMWIQFTMCELLLKKNLCVRRRPKAKLFYACIDTNTCSTLDVRQNQMGNQTQFVEINIPVSINKFLL